MDKQRHKRLIGPRSPWQRAVIVGVMLVLCLGVFVPTEAGTVRNFIYMIGDGMSFEQLEAARIVKGGPLVMDTLPIQHRAVNASLNNPVTDSAAGGTAHATGYRTNNGMIAMLPDGTKLDTILTKSKAAGKATGIVVTDVIYGATPGSFIAHAPSRHDYADITEEAIFVTRPDVLLGGGMDVFDQIGAAARLGQTGYQMVKNRNELLAFDRSSGTPLLGLFATRMMAYEVDRKSNEPHIAEMTTIALDILSREPNGFFIMVEGARIDHAGHANDLRRMAHEVLAFDEAIAVALKFAQERDDTVVLISADHETGGLTPGSKQPSAQVIGQGVEYVRDRIMRQYEADPTTDISVAFERYAGITDLETYVQPGSFRDLIDEILTDHAFYYTRTSHTNAQVPVIAYGPGAEQFAQAEHIADVGQTALTLLGLPLEGVLQ